MQTSPQTYSAFLGHRLLASGSLLDVALPVKRALEDPKSHHILVFDNLTGRQIDFDVTGPEAEVLARMRSTAAGPIASAGVMPATGTADEPRRRGRPRLGVVAREVTLLPRHWEWLASQPGGASVALRKLVEQARRTSSAKDALRTRQERAYHFMSAIGGNLADFEEVIRALFANDERTFRELIDGWPPDIRDASIRFAFDDGTSYLREP